MWFCKLLILVAFLCLAGTAAQGASKRAPAKQAAAVSKKAASATKRAGKTAARSFRKKGRTATASSRTRSSGPPRQSAPTPERYMEVQQALADKGYYSGPVDGSWDTECIAALKRFQADQNIPVDGKLGALSLIGLGLGPKREPLQTQMLARPADPTPTP